MTTAYTFASKPKITSFEGLPESIVLKKTGESVVFDVFREELDFNNLYEIFQEIVVEGQTYPNDTIDEQGFRQYFLSYNCFVFRLASNNQTIGGFYIKPNFPGMSQHIANFGMAIKMEYRSRGLGHLILQRVSKLAKTIGYEALYTNLVFVTNSASVALCKGYGFVEVGRLPRAGNLKGLGFTDALQLYKDVRNV